MNVEGASPLSSSVSFANTSSVIIRLPLSIRKPAPSSNATGASFVLFTVKTKVSATASPEGSVAVIVILCRPTSPFSGVPLKVNVGISKDSQLGKAEPLAEVALINKLSPSGSINVPAGTVNVNNASSSIV